MESFLKHETLYVSLILSKWVNCHWHHVFSLVFPYAFYLFHSEEPSIAQQHPLSSAAYWRLTPKKVHLVWTPFLYFAAAGCSRLSLKFLYLVSSYNLCLLWTNSKFSACWREIFFICNQHKPFCWSLAHWPNTGSLCGLFTHFILMVISGGLKIRFQYSLHNSKCYNIKRVKMNKAFFGQ